MIKGKLLKYRESHTDEQVLSMVLIISCIILTMFFAIVRLCNGLWFRYIDFNSVKLPSFIIQQHIMMILQIFEMLFCYKLLLRTSWLISLILAIIHTVLSGYIPYPYNIIVCNIFWLSCGLITTKSWKTIVDFIFLFTVISLYGLLFVNGLFTTFSAQNSNFLYNVLGTIDYKLFIVSLYLIINYFGGIKLCKKKPTLILLNQQKLNKTKPLPTSPAVHSYGSGMTNQQ